MGSILKAMALVPPMSFFAVFLLLWVQGQHSLAWYTPTDPGLEYATNSTPPNLFETLVPLPIGLYPFDGGPFWTSVRTTSVSQIAPSRHHDGVLERPHGIILIFSHLDFDEILCRTLRASPCGPTVVASCDDEVGTRSLPTEFRRLLKLLRVRSRG